MPREDYKIKNHLIPVQICKRAIPNISNIYQYKQAPSHLIIGVRGCFCES